MATATKDKQPALTGKDKIVDELIQLTQQRKDEIAKAEKPTWLTNCSFGYENSSLRTNIRTVSSIPDLVAMLAYVYGKAKDFDAANAVLGAHAKFEWLGFSLGDWTADFKTRVDQVNLTKKKAELDEIERQLDGLISKERREELQLAAIAAKLKGG